MICFVLMGLCSQPYALSLSYDRTYDVDSPNDVDLDTDGNMYVVRNTFTESVYVLNPDGYLMDYFDIERFLQVKWVDNTLYLLGYSRGLYYATEYGDNAQFVYKPPSGTTYGMDYYDGQMVMSNRVGDQIIVLEVDGTSTEVVTTYNTSALSTETAIAVDPRNGRIYISDKTGSNIYYVNDEGGLTLFISGRSTYDLEVDEHGYVYLGDSIDDAVFVYTPDGELAASIGSYGSGEGQFYNIRGLAIFNNELYVADPYNDTIQVFDIIQDVTPPDPPSSFIGSSTGSDVSLSWTNPAEDFASVTLRRSVESYPTSITDGTDVTSNFTEESLSQSSVEDGTYYYSIFALDGVGNVSTPSTASVVVDTEAPDAVTGFSGEQLGDTVSLNWSNPEEDDFSGVTIRRSTESYPSSITDGTEVTSNSTEESLSQTSVEDGTYYYSIFALDSYENVSEVATVSVTVDDTAPSAVSDFEIDFIVSTVNLSWSNPVEDFVGVTIRRSEEGYPSSITDGVEVTSNSSAESLSQGSVEDGAYYYSIFALDSYGNVSEKATASVLIDTIAPDAPVVTAEKISPNSNVIDISWTVPEGTAMFEIRRLYTVWDVTVLERYMSSSVTSYRDTIESDGTYFYGVYATDEYGNKSLAGYSNSVVVDREAPSAVTEFEAEASDDTVILSWTNPEEEDLAGVTIRRSSEGYPSSISDGVEVTSNFTEESLSQTSVEDGTYYYSIFALDLYTNVSLKATANVVVDTVAPDAPEVTFTKEDVTYLHLEWEGSEDTVAVIIEVSVDSGEYESVGRYGGSSSSYSNPYAEDGSYIFRLYAEDESGNRSVAVTTNAEVIDTVSPDGPDLSAEKNRINGTTITLSWMVPESTSRFELRVSTGNSQSVVSTNIPSTVTDYTHTDLVDGTYEYSIYAIDAYGNNSEAGTTQALVIDITVPSPVMDFEAEPSDDTVILTWSNPELDFESVTIRRSTGSYPSSIADGTEVTSNFTEEGLSQTSVADGTYYYSIFVLDSYANVSEVATVSVTVDDTAPSAVSDFVVEESDDTVSLSWTNPEEDDFTSVTIRRSTEGYPSSVTEGTVVTSNSTAERLVQYNLEDGTYYYSIFALDRYSNSSDAATVSVTVDDTAPSAASNFSADAIDDVVVLSWDNPDSDFESITIRRGFESYPDYITDGTVVTSDSTAEQVRQQHLDDGVYYYTLFVVDAYDNISEGVTVSVTVDDTAPDAPDLTVDKESENGSSVYVSWTASLGADTYTLRRRSGDSTSVVSSNIAGTSYVDTDVPDGRYMYSVVAIDSFGNESSEGTANAVVIDTTAPESASHFSAVASRNLSVTLSWDPVEDNGLDGYMLRRSELGVPASITEGDAITDNYVNGVAYIDRRLDAGVYYYALFSVDQYGNISDSSTASVTVTVSQTNLVNDGQIGRGSVTLDDPQEEPVVAPVVGSRGDVTVNVRTTFQSDGLVVGDTNGAQSTIILDESDSDLTDAGDVVVGRKGQGRIIQSAGTMRVGGTLSLGNSTEGAGTYELSGGEFVCDTLDLTAGTSESNPFTWTGGTMSPRQVVGNLENNGGGLVVKSGTPVRIQGRYTQSTQSTLHYVMESSASENRTPLMTIDDSTLLSGTIKLTLDGYTPRAGQRIYLLNSDAVSSLSSNGLRIQSSITFDLEELDDGLEWDTSDFESDGSIAIMSTSSQLVDARPLNYPNPFEFSSGTDIVYTLTRAANVELRVYSAWGQEVYRDSFVSGENGGKVGDNTVSLSLSVTGQSWPSGVYFYLLMEEGSVVAKGKLAVLPE